MHCKLYARYIFVIGVLITLRPNVSEYILQAVAKQIKDIKAQYYKSNAIIKSM